MISAWMPGSRNIISVELIPSADAILNQTVRRTGLAKKDVIARMFAWLADQDVDVQRVVLGEIPDSLAGAAKELALRKLRGVSPVEPSPAPKPPIHFDAVAASIRSAPEHAAPAPEKRRRGRADKHD